MPRCLVVANRTLGGEHLVEALRQRADAGSARFHLLVPVEHPNDRTWTEGGVAADAARRLDAHLAALRAMGFDVDGEVGDHRVVDAVGAVLRREPFDEVILSTLPPGPSRWLKWDLPHRLAQAFPHVPVTHVIAVEERGRHRARA